MKKGEKGIFALIGLSVVMFVVVNHYRQAQEEGEDPGIPFYSTADAELKEHGAKLYRQFKCRDCHTLWGVRNPMQSVPAPSLDGIGSLKSEQWLYDYLSAKDPQAIIPSRLKAEYRMPSFAFLTEEDRRTLSAYLASLKVEAWYLEKSQKAEYEKLTGQSYEERSAHAN